MTCACHGEPMRWSTDRRRKSGGYWSCAVRRAASDAKGRKERQLRYWHKANGGYIVRRRRQLASAREAVTEQLRQLDMEARLAEP